MSTGVSTYPARIEGRLDPALSRWLWLVKWLLLIPHAIALAFLWIGFAFTTVIAFFVILFTGRYPRALFDFGVGVLRWSWRVAFYAFDANGTDRYPPFTLAAIDYPATLEVDYPERLSRGLVLVKWWLLAIPHYLVVGFLLGGAWLAWSDRPGPVVSMGLISVLVLIAVVALLFTGRYPGGIFDLVLGLNRWVLRVAAYSLLMTDRYPPFRLDLGPIDGPTVPAGSQPVPTAAKTDTGRWGPGRILAVIGGGVAGLVGLALLIGGIAAVVVDQTQRDSRGYVMTSTETLATPTYAIASERVDTGIDGHDVFVAREILGTVRVRTHSDRPTFVGIARSDDVARYLAGVRHEEARDIAGPGSTSYVLRPGGRSPRRPAAQGFWAASTQGRGAQSLTWKVRDGSWRLVVMNADGAARVSADMSVGARLPHLLAYAGGLLGAAVLLLAAAGGLVYLGARGTAGSPNQP